MPLAEIAKNAKDAGKLKATANYNSLYELGVFASWREKIF